jgi:uncharacterized damage-inducible protein DinB
MTADQASFLLATSLVSLRNEHQVTKRVIEAIPTQNSDYRPDPAAKTAMELAWHMVAAEKRFFHAIASGAFDFTPIPRPENVKTPSDISAWCEANFAEGFAALEKLSTDQLLKMVDFRGMFQLPAIAYIQFILSHTIHHRGQLSTYLRPMGGTVPSIYGESHDAARARLAQTQEAKAS